MKTANPGFAQLNKIQMKFLCPIKKAQKMHGDCIPPTLNRQEKQMPHASSHSMASPKMRDCISACNACAESCNETLVHCLQMGGKHAEAAHIGSLVDCAEICRTSAAFLGRMSSAHSKVCAACADVCRTCEKSCRALGDDETMRACAEECARCAESCEAMAKQ